MFLSKHYVLGNELVQVLGIDIANISIARKALVHNDDYYSILKMNNCSFIHSKAKNLPSYLKRGIDQHEFTDMSNLLLCSYFKTEFNITERELENSKICTSRTVVAGKSFYVFDRQFADLVHQHIPYVLTDDENTKCKKDGTIIDSVKLSKNKFLAWY